MAWYDRKGVIIFFLLFLFPIGLLMMLRSPTFGVKAKGAAVILFVLLIIAGASDKDKTKSTTQNPPAVTKVEQSNQTAKPVQSAPPKPAAPAKVLNLGMTVEQFTLAYNVNANELSPEGGLNISSVNVASGKESDGFSYQFLPNVGMIGEI